MQVPWANRHYGDQDSFIRSHCNADWICYCVRLWCWYCVSVSCPVFSVSCPANLSGVCTDQCCSNAPLVAVRPAPLSPLISSLLQSWGSGIWSVNTDTGCDPSMNGGHTHVELSWSYQTRRERVNSRWGNQSKLRWLVTIQGDKTLKWVKWPTVIRWGRYIVSYPCFHCPRLPSEQQPKMWTK